MMMMMMQLMSYPRQSSVDTGGLVGDGDDSKKAEVDARRHALDVDPERHPRHDDRENARRKHLDHVVADISL